MPQVTSTATSSRLTMRRCFMAGGHPPSLDGEGQQYGAVHGREHLARGGLALGHGVAVVGRVAGAGGIVDAETAQHLVVTLGELVPVVVEARPGEGDGPALEGREIDLHEAAGAGGGEAAWVGAGGGLDARD